MQVMVGSWLGRVHGKGKVCSSAECKCGFRKSNCDVQCMLEYLSGSHKSSGGVSA